MNAVAHAPIAHINLFNPGLMPAAKSFSARSVAVWAVIGAIVMIGLAWWAIVEKQNISKQVAEQQSRRDAEARGDDVVTTPQQIAALEQALRTKHTVLEERRNMRDALKRGIAADGGGPSMTMKIVAATIPADVWITDMTARADRLEISGRTIDPSALAGWMARMGETSYFAAKPVSSMRLENTAFAPINAGAVPAAGSPSPGVPAANRRLNIYSFNITAQLARPFADEGARAP